MANELTAELKASLTSLYHALTDAYWAAGSIADKDRIRGLADSVSDALDEIDVKEIEDRTEAFAALAAEMNTLSSKLDSLQADIDKIIHNVKIATSVVSAVQKTAGTLAKFAV